MYPLSGPFSIPTILTSYPNFSPSHNLLLNSVIGILIFSFHEASYTPYVNIEILQSISIYVSIPSLMLLDGSILSTCRQIGSIITSNSSL